jgi:hypothetical protein
VLSGEATNTNFISVGLTRLGLEHTIYHTRREHATHYTTDAVKNTITIVHKAAGYISFDMKIPKFLK